MPKISPQQLEDIENAEVSIAIYLPSGKTVVINDPQDFNFKENRLWIQASDREHWFVNTPFQIVDKRVKKKKSSFAS